MSQTHYKTMKDRSKKQRTEDLIKRLASEVGRLNKYATEQEKHNRILRKALWIVAAVCIVSVSWSVCRFLGHGTFSIVR